MATIWLIRILLGHCIWVVHGQGGCPNQCSRRGTCDTFGTCACWDTWTGADCSLRTCPYNTAWADVATATDTAHASAECSNMGSCDRAAGVCQCQPGFEGPACNRMACPNKCSGHGLCLSMSRAASTNDGFHLNRTSTYTAWDGNMIYGCVCDAGFTGYDCGQRLCDSGDDYFTTGQQDEIVFLYCECGGTCSGTVQLSFKAQSATITPSMNASQVASALMGLASIKSSSSVYTSTPIQVTYSGGTEVCSSAGTTSTIAFARDHGDLPPTYIRNNNLQSSTSVVSVTMTTQIVLECICTTCGGYFNLVGTEGEVTRNLPYNAAYSDITTALGDITSLSSATISVTTPSGAVCVDGAAVTQSTITIDLDFGNYGLTVLNSLTDSGLQGGTINVITNDGTTESTPCCGGGGCDYSTGQCTCWKGRTYDEAYGECGGYHYDSSQWPGTQNCSGLLDRSSGIPLPYSNYTNDIQAYVGDHGGNGSVQTAGFYMVQPSLTQAVTAFSLQTSASYVTNAIALDMSYRVIYWAEANIIYSTTLPSDTLYNYKQLPTTATVTTFFTAGADIDYLELDLRPDQRYAYFTMPGVVGSSDGLIYRKQLDTSGTSAYDDLSVNIQPGLQSLGVDLVDPHGLALDLNNDKLFFADSMLAGALGMYDGFVARCELDGTGVELAVAANLSDPWAIALDMTAPRAGSGYLYVTDIYNASILKAPAYNDTSEQQVTRILDCVNTTYVGAEGSVEYCQSLIEPKGIQIDSRPNQNTLFFSDYSIGYMFTATIDGEGAVRYLALGSPGGFVFDFNLGPPRYLAYSDCWGHGSCSGAPYFHCTCDDGWVGDCSQTTCPQGPAWFDQAQLDGSAHARAECSNMGQCDRTTGQCSCHTGFEGEACERMSCPNDCNGHGQCLSMRQMALAATDADVDLSPEVYGSYASPTAWDADSIQGCLCDWYGYQSSGPSYHNASDYRSFDCSMQTCPTGNNPSVWVGTNASVWDVQKLTCEGTAGGFTLSFRGQTTSLMNANTTTVADLEDELELLDTIGDLELSNALSTDLVCTIAGTTDVDITFMTELGSLPLLILEYNGLSGASGVANVTISKSVPGTRLDAECSVHGICDAGTGECSCFLGWGSSDGAGGVGFRRDCGWYATQNSWL